MSILRGYRKIRCAMFKEWLKKNLFLVCPCVGSWVFIVMYLFTWSPQSSLGGKIFLLTVFSLIELLIIGSSYLGFIMVRRGRNKEDQEDQREKERRLQEQTTILELMDAMSRAKSSDLRGGLCILASVGIMILQERVKFPELGWEVKSPLLIASSLATLTRGYEVMLGGREGEEASRCVAEFLLSQCAIRPRKAIAVVAILGRMGIDLSVHLDPYGDGE